MSKSKGNGVEPSEIISKYGADSLRLWYFSDALPGSNAPIREEKIKGNRNFVNKIWNASRFVMMNIDGRILGTKNIPKPVAVAQDYELNLIVCGRFDTTISGQTISLGAVYKLDLVSVSHQIENAPLKRLLPRTSDFNTPQREYTGVTAFYDNSFYVARKGPNNSNLIDPDNSLLKYVVKNK